MDNKITVLYLNILNCIDKGATRSQIRQMMVHGANGTDVDVALDQLVLKKAITESEEGMVHIKDPEFLLELLMNSQNDGG